MSPILIETKERSLSLLLILPQGLMSISEAKSEPEDLLKNRSEEFEEGDTVAEIPPVEFSTEIQRVPQGLVSSLIFICTNCLLPSEVGKAKFLNSLTISA